MVKQKPGVNAKLDPIPVRMPCVKNMTLRVGAKEEQMMEIMMMMDPMMEISLAPYLTVSFPDSGPQIMMIP